MSNAAPIARTIYDASPEILDVKERLETFVPGGRLTSYGIARLDDEGLAHFVIWADSPSHAQEVADQIRRRAMLPEGLPLYVTDVFVAGLLSRVPDHCECGALGRVVVALG